MNNARILKLLLDRADTATSALAQRFGSGLFHLSIHILGNPLDAQESVNDTYLALRNAIPPDRPRKLSSYVYRVGRNHALNRFRENTALKRNTFYDVSLSELADSIPGSDMDSTIDSKVLGQAIDRFLSTLPSTDRILFLRRYWFGDTIPELAQLRRVSSNAISVRLSRIRHKLELYLNKEGIWK